MRGAAASVLTAVAVLSGVVSTQAATECALAHMQCGGASWTGPTCCESGFQCIKHNELVSTCTASRRRLNCRRKTKAPSNEASTITTAPVTTPSPTTTAPASSSDSTAPESTARPTTPSSTRPTTPASTPTPSTTGTKKPATTATPSSSTTSPSPTSAPSTTSTPQGTTKPQNGVYLTYDTVKVAAHNHAAYPSASCAGMPVADCMSGTKWGETTAVSASEPWHYSRSTHFGLTSGGACGFGLYALCTKGSKTASWTDPMLKEYACDAFCTAYPALCQDPKNMTLRGNFAAPNGNYYTQFWPHLEGDHDNYLSCGECFEVIRTKKDGTDYKPGETGYSDPIVLEVIDSCPCDANTKWCCGSGDDQCQEIKDFKYGCPIPKDSTHLDLSDIAMGRLQPTSGTINDGVIPTRYRRVSCPKPGNVYLWLRDSAGPNYFALSVVNAAGVGSVTKVEVKGAGTSTWTALVHDQNYGLSSPQGRYGSWTIPRGSGPFNAPVAMRLTSPNGEQLVNEAAIKSYTAPASAPKGYYYIDFGGQFSAYGKH